MTTALVTWAKTKNEGRDGASATLCFDIAASCRRSAVALARLVDAGNVEDLVRDGDLIPRTYNKIGQRVANWHGVTVVYGSGRTRTVRG